ncbi:MAG TPA: ScpA family protein [Candidatus Paceibacterota bacterium]|jgi:segregation and condensation protein A|nr:ScpA family protein [Candidatus Paceibacterota bacterium]
MTERFELATDAFQGPLETLLNLIEERKMPISEVSLSQVCNAYLGYVEKLPEMPLGETAQFILVASTLLLIKSRSLLPTLELSAEERESVEELERRLSRYALFRKAAKLLRKEWGRAPLFFPKRAPARPPVFSPAEASKPALLAAAQKLLNTLPKPEALMQAAVAPILALEDVIVSLKDRLSRALKTRFSELTKGADRESRIVHFLAMLELVRYGGASATQEKLFSDIIIELENVSGVPKFGV